MRNHLPYVKAHVLTVPEQIKINHIAASQPIHFRVALSLQLHAGLRVGEATKATFNWLKPTPQTCTEIIIPAHVAKSRQARSVPLTPELQTLLRLCWMETTTRQPAADPNTTRLVQSPKQTRYTPRWMNKKLKIICRNHDLRHFHTHCLRHTFANNVLKIANLRIVQTLLGHASLATTQLYLHPTVNDMETAVRDAAAYPYNVTHNPTLEPTSPTPP